MQHGSNTCAVEAAHSALRVEFQSTIESAAEVKESRGEQRAASSRPRWTGSMPASAVERG